MTDAKISRSDIETKFRDIQTEVSSVAEGARSKIVAGAGVAAVIVVLLVFLLGRRSGKKKSTIVEIRRL
jgi:hypothetical protein